MFLKEDWWPEKKLVFKMCTIVIVMFEKSAMQVTLVAVRIGGWQYNSMY